MVSNIPSQQNYAVQLPNAGQKEQVTQKNPIMTPAQGKWDRDTFKKEGLSTGKKIAIAVGLGATIAGGIYLVKSGKGKQAIETVKSFFNKSESVAKDQIKEFADDAGNAVNNVKLLKGKALLENGEGFTGVMKTVTKSGKNVKLKYSQGLLESSAVDGNVLKKYGYPKDVDSKTLIAKFNKDGKLTEYIEHSYDIDESVRELFVEKYAGQNIQNHGSIEDRVTDIYLKMWAAKIKSKCAAYPLK